MSSAEASPVRIFLSLAKELGSLASEADFGRSMRDSFASFDHATSSWRTSQHCLLEGFQRYSETWPRSGMTLNGTACPLPTLAPLTDETESGLLPTPAATSYGTNQRGSAGRTGPIRPSLETMARRGLWPTPRSADADKGIRT